VNRPGWFRHDDFAAAPINGQSWHHHNLFFVVGQLDIQSANHPGPGHHPIQEPALRIEVVLFQIEMIDIEQLSIVVAVPDRRLQIGRRLNIDSVMLSVLRHVSSIVVLCL
jgi:hypothetical protein